jgi:uncharacterized membrane protein
VIVANLGLIASVVLIPFSTAAVGDPGLDDLPLPTALLAVNIAATSALHTLVYAMAARRGLFATRPSRGEFNATVLASLAPAAVFLASLPIAYLVTPIAAQLSWLSLIVIGPWVGRRAGAPRGAS